MRAALQDGWDALHGRGPAVSARMWPAALRQHFPGPRRLLEAWQGEGAAFARYTSAQGPLFLKYLPAGWNDARAFARFEREIVYLRDLAPLAPFAHPAHLHSALDVGRNRAHLLTRDLTAETRGWGAFQTDQEREIRLLEVARLLAQFHAFWAGKRAWEGFWPWEPEQLVTQAHKIAAKSQGVHAGAIQAAAKSLPQLLAAAPLVTLVHGDIHAGQVLFPLDGRPPILLDFGQVHPSIPGEDLAHLLAVRLDAPERVRLGPPLRQAYLSELQAHSIKLSATDLAAQEQVGLALNLLSIARQTRRNPGSGVQLALENVAQAWAESFS